MEGLNTRKTALSIAIALALSFGMVACGGGGGGHHSVVDGGGSGGDNGGGDNGGGDNGGGDNGGEEPYTGPSWFDPQIVAAQNAATTDEAKEAIAKQRAKEVIAAMTEDEKLDQLTGAGNTVVPELPECFADRAVSDAQGADP